MTEAKPSEDESSGPAAAEAIDADDPHKVEKLAKLGKRDQDPDAGSD